MRLIDADALAERLKARLANNKKAANDDAYCQDYAGALRRQAYASELELCLLNLHEAPTIDPEEIHNA